MTDLLKLRDEIDLTDAGIVELFEKRMRLVESVARYKIETGKQVLDSRREEEKLTALGERASTDFNKKGIREVFRQLMSISRKRQYQILADYGKGYTVEYSLCDGFPHRNARIIYQGVEGAYSFVAMKAFFGSDVQGDHVDTWQEAISSVENGNCDYAVLPLENSTAGSVSDIYDLMLSHKVYMIGEQIIPVDHKLAVLPGTSEEEIRTVFSHPQALAQCRGYLEKHPAMRPETMLNTAMAAAKVAADGDRTQAAIASAYAAEHYGLQVLDTGPLASVTNETRFAIISGKNCFVKDAGKISICFELPHQCGTLYHILSHFIFNDLNMTKIESRPIPGRSWEYRFFVDFDGNLSDPAVQNALSGIRAETADPRLLGNY